VRGLNLCGGHNPDAPRVERIKELPVQHIHAHRCRYAERHLLVISSETKVPPVIGSLITPQREIDALVAKIDKGGGLVLVRNPEINRAALGV